MTSKIPKIDAVLTDLLKRVKSALDDVLEAWKVQSILASQDKKANSAI